MCPVNLAWVNKENKNSNLTLNIGQENCNDFRDTDSWLQTWLQRDIEHCYNLMTHFQGLGVLSVSARKPVLTYTAFL